MNSLYFKELYRWKHPASMCIESTNRCNLKCSHCHQSHFSMLHGDFDLKMFYALMEHIDTSTVISLSSMGEPLISKTFRPIFDYLSENGYSISFTTNGLLLEKYFDVLLDKAIGITVSMDGADSDIYKSIRGIKNESLLRNIETINSLKQLKNTDKPIISFTTVLSKVNIEDLPNVIHLANKLGVKTVVAYHRLFYDKDEFRRDSLFFHPEISDAIHIEALELAKHYGINFYHTPLFEENNIPVSEQNLFNNYISIDKKTCMWIVNTVIVGWHGTIFACCYADRLLMGSLKHNSFNDIWNGPFYRKLRLDHINQSPPDVCSQNCIAMQSVDTSNENYFKYEIDETYLQNEDLIGPLPYSYNLMNNRYMEAVKLFENSYYTKSLNILEELECIDGNFFEVYHLMNLIYEHLDDKYKSDMYLTKTNKICSSYKMLLNCQ